ncbi:cytochrome c-type biogenesis protein [Rickettsiales endosymbiont of Stachyamoeba lipophora]|uniref:cytochrome c-type biogenesis protein n=1 Tax=Rickettsiales endosymbiont of Stachyamoeba lipophora TaxID=2486578 RepID=UPI0013DDC5F2|nr:cytochrome c-type biogenesis protein CcmH [Rickettsiales endosymbiont of Stachyamoeba lipophora]
MIINNLYADYEQDKQREYYLYQQFKCLTCAGQTIEGSNTEFAIKLKQQIVNLMEQGNTNEEIIQIIIDEYGEQVLANPDLEQQKLLMIIPILIGVLGAGLLILLYIRKRTQV